MDPVEVREAQVTDAGPFATFIRRAWEEAGPAAPGFAGATDEAIDEIARRDTFEARIADPRQHLLLALQSHGPDGAGGVIGFCALRAIDDTTVELAGIVVGADHAGHGVGTMLVEGALAEAATRGHRTCVVRTETTNRVARAFYEKCGFTGATRQVEVVDGTAIEVWELRRSLVEPDDG